MVDPNRIMELQQELLSLRIIDWYEKVFSFQWFFIIFLIIVPWVIWWRLVNKRYIAEILFLGLLIMVTASILFEIGLQLLLWKSPYTLAPAPPRWYAPAYSYTPVAFMLIYQYFRTWKSFTLVTIVFATISAFVVQPILTWLDMYILIKWNYFYSFLTFIIIGLGTRLLHQVVFKREPMLIENKDNFKVERQPNLASPALKRIKNKKRR